jgi:hypothetical protein
MNRVSLRKTVHSIVAVILIHFLRITQYVPWFNSYKVGDYIRERFSIFQTAFQLAVLIYDNVAGYRFIG